MLLRCLQWGRKIETIHFYTFNCISFKMTKLFAIFDLHFLWWISRIGKNVNVWCVRCLLFCITSNHSTVSFPNSHACIHTSIVKHFQLSIQSIPWLNSHLVDDLLPPLFSINHNILWTFSLDKHTQYYCSDLTLSHTNLH